MPQAKDAFDADIVVIGAGAVGLAIAATLSAAGRDVLILEKNGAIGEETSSRNSEVIHAGLYYPEGSLKGRLCVRGRDLLYEWCARYAVPHRRCGKLIVATETDEEPALERIRGQAAGNGVTELEALSGAQAKRMEPAIRSCAALWSPLTGILDSHAFMLSLLGAAEENGAILALNCPIVKGETLSHGVRLETGGKDPARITARVVVNSAGLWAQRVATMIDGPHREQTPPSVYLKGNYFALSGLRAPFTRLIYPAPVSGGLGVHLTLDLAGRARFGPDVEPLTAHTPQEIDYTVDPARGAVFYDAIRRYWPTLPDGSLHPDYAGVRPKIDTNRLTDFQIHGPREHGVAGLYHLYGFESPALTGSLAIAELLAARILSECA